MTKNTASGYMEKNAQFLGKVAKTVAEQKESQIINMEDQFQSP